MHSPYTVKYLKVKELLTVIEEHKQKSTDIFYTFDTPLIPGLTQARLKEPKQQDERKKIRQREKEKGTMAGTAQR